MGEAKRRNQQGEGVLNLFTQDHVPFSVKIERSPLSSRYLCRLNILTVTSTITVWDTVFRAREGRKDITNHLNKIQAQELFTPNGYTRFISALKDDDDQILGVYQNGKLDTSQSTRELAMGTANQEFIAAGRNERFRINGETIL